MIWDEVAKEWKPRFGYNKVGSDKEQNWVVEVCLLEILTMFKVTTTNIGTSLFVKLELSSALFNIMQNMIHPQNRKYDNRKYDNRK